MNTNSILILVFGIICSLLSITYFTPQVIKVIKDKNAANVSTWFCIFGIVSSLVWIIFGSVIISSLNQDANTYSLVIGLPIIISNILLVILQTVLLILKIKNIRFVKANNLNNKKNEKDKKDYINDK